MFLNKNVFKYLKDVLWTATDLFYPDIALMELPLFGDDAVFWRGVKESVKGTGSTGAFAEVSSIERV